jgi:hypothetical protein
MSARLIIGLAALALIGGGIWLIGRNNGVAHDSTTTAAPAPASRAATAPSRAPVVAPSLGGSAVERLSGSAAEAAAAAIDAKTAADFNAEVRDSTWAPNTEAELGRRLADLPGANVASECRRTLCRITLTDIDLNDIGRGIGRLESPRGLRGFAASELLGTPTKRPDGSFELNIYANFDRN